MMSFRRFEMSDLPYAKNLIADAWYGKSYDMMSPERAEDCFRFYIGRYLSRCTFAEMCEMDGRPAGFIIGVADDEERLFPNETFPSEKSVPWWLGLSMFKIIKADRRMLAECGD